MAKHHSIEHKSRVSTLSDEGMSHRTIEEKTGIHRATIRYILRKKKEKGTLEWSPRSRRPKALTEKDINFIKEKIQDNPKISSTKLSKFILLERNINYTPRTIRNYLYEIGYGCFRPFKETIYKPSK